MELFRIIKSDAKKALRFCSGRITASAIIIALFWLLFTVAESVLHFIFVGPKSIYFSFENVVKSPVALSITTAISVVWLFVMPALFLGFKKLCLYFAEGKDESISMIFDTFTSFKKFFGSFFFAIGFAIRWILVFGIAILPGGSIFWFTEKYVPDSGRLFLLIKVSLFFLAGGIMVLCVFLGIIFTQRWSIAAFYRTLGFGVQKSFSLSAKATKGFCTNIISFKFSFIGWGLLSLLIFPLLYSIPFYSVSFAIYGKYLMQRYENSLAEVPEILSEDSAAEEEIDG